MSDSGIKDTTAYRIIRQMTDHIWGSDEKFEDSDVIAICRLFSSRGGNWEALMDGSMDQAVRLEECLGVVVKYMHASKIATKLVSKMGHR